MGIFSKKDGRTEFLFERVEAIERRVDRQNENIHELENFVKSIYNDHLQLLKRIEELPVKKADEK